MERIMSAQDRIRRAEEIYNKRRQDANQKVSIRTSSINKNEKIKFGLFKKMILQIAICIVIYMIVFLVKNSEFFFTNDFIDNVKYFLAYDVDFNKIYENISNYYDNSIKPFIIKNINSNNNTLEENNEQIEKEINKDIENKEIDNEQENEQDEQIKEDEQISEQKNDIYENNIKEVVANAVVTDVVEKKELSQMEIDANDVKNSVSLIIPLTGIISSRFGPRTPTDIVSAYHKGIDIAVNEGTVFVAAMDGKVITASSYGSYGNHIFIQNGDVITVYAHCKKLYVKEGDNVTKGQEIGEVGHTGNATGPHLHFEIRKDGRHINPEYILSFV